MAQLKVKYLGKKEGQAERLPTGRQGVESV